MSVAVQLICLNAGKAVVTGSNGMHGLVISMAGDRVDAIAGQFRFLVAHLHGAGETTVLWKGGNGQSQHSKPHVRLFRDPRVHGVGTRMTSDIDLT